jgi:hypothetical protein
MRIIAMGTRRWTESMNAIILKCLNVFHGFHCMASDQVQFPEFQKSTCEGMRNSRQLTLTSF